jgi:putative endonuclease
MAYVYILKSINFRKTYTGSTSRTLDQRLSEHNSGLSTYTKRYLPWELIYFEEYDNLTEARLREKYLKSAAGRRFIKKNNIIRA